MKQVSTVALINEDGQLFLMKRSDEITHWSGVWNFPGGSVDEGETYAEAAIRELKEEAGLDVDPNDLFYLGHLDTDDGKRIHIHVSEEHSGEVNMNWESSDWAWVSFDDLHEYPFVGGGTLHEDVRDSIISFIER